MTIHEVTDATRLGQWREAVHGGFGWPAYGVVVVADNLPFLGFGADRHVLAYVALRRLTPVGSSLVFFGAGVAGVYHVATAPEERNEGIGAAITHGAAPGSPATWLWGRRVTRHHHGGTRVSAARLHPALQIDMYRRLVPAVAQP